MSRNAKTAAVAVLAGLMLTVAVIAATSGTDDPGSGQVARRSSGGDPLAAELARCSRLTMPDSSCEAVWNAHRRRFLGDDVIEVVPDPDSFAGSLNTGAADAVPTPSPSY